LTTNLQILDSLLIETLLFGDDSLSEEQNAQIFKSVQLYIKQTKRLLMINHLNHQMSNSNNTVPSITSDKRERNITTGLFGLSNEI
jgi:hypothetical protein